MRALQADEILRIWELGQDRPNWQRGLLMLAPRFPELRLSALAQFQLERRNRLLLELRERTVGNSLQALVRCPSCRVPLEFFVTVRELLDEPAVIAHGGEGEAVSAVEFEGATLQYRLPTSRDLAAAAGFLDLPEAAQNLGLRSIMHGLEGLDADEEGRALACVEAEIARVSPLTDIRVVLRCASGEHVWAASLDIASFFWIELDRMARQLLDDVQTLARGYGWQEEGILAMSESRRQFYLGALQS